MRILVVEDDSHLRNCVSNLLLSSGYDVASVESLRETFESVVTFDPEIIILDLKLPDSDGVETLESVKAMVKDEVTIVVYSGTSLWEKECLRLGADDFMAKGDITKEALIDVIHLAVNQHRLDCAVNNRCETSLGGLLKLDTVKIGDSLIAMAQELRALAAG